MSTLRSFAPSTSAQPESIRRGLEDYLQPGVLLKKEDITIQINLAAILSKNPDRIKLISLGYWWCCDGTIALYVGEVDSFRMLRRASALVRSWNGVCAASRTLTKTTKARETVLKNRFDSDQPDASKVSVSFCTKDKPGELERALGFFWKHDLNMTRIESRPASRGSKFEVLAVSDLSSICSSMSRFSLMKMIPSSKDCLKNSMTTWRMCT